MNLIILSKMVSAFHTYSDYITFSIGVFGYLLAIITWCKQKFPFLYKKTFMTLKILIKRKKIIIIWNDSDLSVSDSLLRTLKISSPQFMYYSINTPCEILSYPLFTWAVHLIIFIDTDVTKLSDDDNEREKIQNHILKYVKQGGTFVGTHDIIYRRVRNSLFEQAYGCQINNFRRFDRPIKYKIVEAYRNHPILDQVNSDIFLDDGEICWGEEWEPVHSVISLFESEEKLNKDKPVPLMTLQNYHDGFLIWMNGSDKLDTVKPGVRDPQFCQIITNIIKFIEKPALANDADAATQELSDAV